MGWATLNQCLQMQPGCTTLHDVELTAHALVLSQGFCNKIHKTLLKQLKYANVWGASAKHRPQKVGKEHGLVDEDIVQVNWGVWVKIRHACIACRQGTCASLWMCVCVGGGCFNSPDTRELIWSFFGGKESWRFCTARSHLRRHLPRGGFEGCTCMSEHAGNPPLPSCCLCAHVDCQAYLS
jgi:hypothetical protein